MIGVKQFFRLFAQRFLQPFLIKLFDVFVFVAETHGHVLIQLVQKTASFFGPRLVVAVDGLAAASGAAAGTGHDFHKIIMDFAA